MRSIEEVTAKLYEIDPMGLAKVDCPKDEYYTEAMLIMLKKDKLTAANVRDVFYDMFEAGLAEPNYNIQKWQVDFVQWFNQEED